MRKNVFSNVMRVVWNQMYIPKNSRQIFRYPHFCFETWNTAAKACGRLDQCFPTSGSRSISKFYSFLLDREIFALSLRNKYATM